MTEFSPAAWLWWAGVVMSASAAGYCLARRMPWAAEARSGTLTLAFGICLGPFLAGLAAVAVLGLLPGAEPRLHLAVVLGLLSSVTLIDFSWSRRRAGVQRITGVKPTPAGVGGIAWVVIQLLVLGWILLLFFEALFLPLIANDALEYATVGRLLFETRTLLDYPAIDPARGSSGFFAPWTHPPLYVAQLYLAYAAQGHADMPGLGRTVAPWFFMGAALLVRAMGNLCGRFVGLVAMLVFVSTPLAVEGAASASIDPLTMAGAAMILCGIALFSRGTGAPQAGVLGALIGLGLWAHSSAVVMLPISLTVVWILQGTSPTRRHLTTSLVILLAAVAVAAWPYGRNLLLFGSLISDNPVVFNMPELRWDEYFVKARSLESWPERIQFGILKPWTALRSFGLTFWLLLPAAWIALAWVAGGGWRSFPGSAVASPSRRLLVAAGLILACYWAGMTASTLLGMDLMIKNDRYMLVVVPCAALVAGWVMGRILASVSWVDEGPQRWRDHARAVSVAALSAALVVLWGVSAAIQGSRVRQLGVSAGEIASRSHSEKLRGWAGFQVARALSAQPPEAIVLAERPADLYYADRRMMSFLDPRLVPVYREQDPARAVQMLASLGVTHLQMPGYSHPAIYRTAVQAIAARPDLSTLVFSAGADQLYSLGGAVGRIGAVRQVGPGHHPWVQAVRLVPFASSGFLIASNSMNSNALYEGGLPVPLLQRSVSSELMFGGSPDLRGVQNQADLLPLSKGREFVVEIELEGDAYASALLYYFDANRRPAMIEGRPSEVIGEIALSPESGRRTLMRRVRIARADAAFIRLVIEHRGNTTMRIVDVRVTDIHRAAPREARLE